MQSLFFTTQKSRFFNRLQLYSKLSCSQNSCVYSHQVKHNSFKNGKFCNSLITSISLSNFSWNFPKYHSTKYDTQQLLSSKHFTKRHIGPTEKDKAEMLSFIGVKVISL